MTNSKAAHKAGNRPDAAGFRRFLQRARLRPLAIKPEEQQ